MHVSGLHEALDGVIATHAIPHIISGKAVARAVRAHVLVYAVLHAMLESMAYNTYLSVFEDDIHTEGGSKHDAKEQPGEANSDGSFDISLVKTLEMFDKLVSGTVALEAAAIDVDVEEVNVWLARVRESLL